MSKKWKWNGKYPVRCKIVDVEGGVLEPGRDFDTPVIARNPDESKPHLGKFGKAEISKGVVKITLDDGSTLYGHECWWIPVAPEGEQPETKGEPSIRDKTPDERWPDLIKIWDPAIILTYLNQFCKNNPDQRGMKRLRNELHRYLMQRIEEEKILRGQLVDALVENMGCHIMQALEKKFKEDKE